MSRLLRLLIDRHDRHGAIGASAEDGVFAVEARGDPSFAIVIWIVEQVRAGQLRNELHVAIFMEHILSATAMIGRHASRLVIARSIRDEHILLAPEVAGWQQ